ncbi:MAG: VOC family protein [Acidobacteriota bacterium]|nr:MAG: VOC family protein [Acidobacteriota bacterium]
MEVQKHAPGTFCWAELGSTDQSGARKFYQDLFGWKSTEIPMGPDATYTIFNNQGRDVAALNQLQKEQLEMGIPSHWMLYISTDDVDAAAESVKQHGGTILAGPFDVSEEGRMAVVQDPTGARFSIWQPVKNIGVKVINEPNSMCWQELQTHDIDAAEKFYNSVFGWTAVRTGNGNDVYVEFYVGDPSKRANAGGMMAIREEWGEVPPNWSVYFAVDDCDEYAAKATSLGAKQIVPPMDIPEVGRFSVMQDPTGAVFSIIKLNFI